MSLSIVRFTDDALPGSLAVFRALDYDATMDARRFQRLASDDPTVLPDLRFVAVDGDTIVGFVVGCVRQGRLVIKFVAVLREWRRRGIASALLDRVEEAARQHGLQHSVAGGVGPLYFYPGVDLAEAPALSFFWRLGYDTDRVSRVDMRVDLEHTPLDVSSDIRSLADEGLAARRVARDELAAVADLAGTHSNVWREEVEMSGENEPVSAFAVFDGEACVSFAVYGVTGPHRFGPTLTHPDYRRRGLGALLLKCCLADLRSQGYGEAEISWAGPVQYYIRAVKATVHKVYWVFTKQL